MDRVTTNYQFTFPRYVSDDFIEKVPPIFSDIAFFILENVRRAAMTIRHRICALRVCEN